MSQMRFYFWQVTWQRISPVTMAKNRVFFNTVNHALDIMRRGGISASSQQREEADFIEYVVRIPKMGARRPASIR